MPEGINYNNKDILFKVLSQNYENKSLEVYGLPVPRIKKLLPSDFPAVSANELHADNIFLLEDDTILILEYESTVSIANFLKYNNYITRILERLLKKENKIINVIVAVIYTGDITQAPSEFKTGSLHINIMQVFLSNFDTNEIYADLNDKVTSAQYLSDDDIMRFIILPLTQLDKSQKQKIIEQTINLAKQIEDEQQQLFIIAGILTAANKFIDQEYSKQIKEWIKMTKVARLFEEEKLEAVNQAINQAINQANEARRNERITLAKKMFAKGEDYLKIMEYTGFTKEELFIIESTAQSV